MNEGVGKRKVRRCLITNYNHNTQEGVIYLCTTSPNVKHRFIPIEPAPQDSNQLPPLQTSPPNYFRDLPAYVNVSHGFIAKVYFNDGSATPETPETPSYVEVAPPREGLVSLEGDDLKRFNNAVRAYQTSHTYNTSQTEHDDSDEPEKGRKPEQMSPRSLAQIVLGDGLSSTRTVVTPNRPRAEPEPTGKAKRRNETKDIRPLEERFGYANDPYWREGVLMGMESLKIEPDGPIPAQSPIPALRIDMEALKNNKPVMEITFEVHKTNPPPNYDANGDIEAYLSEVFIVPVSA